MGNPNTKFEDLKLLGNLINRSIIWFKMNKDFFNKKNILAFVATISILIGLIYLALVYFRF